MTPQEHDMITQLFDRLKQAEPSNRDREAERLIADAVINQPVAPYQLVQTVLVQNQALLAAQARIAELEHSSGSESASTTASSFLPGGSSQDMLGPWGRRAPPMQSPMPVGGGYNPNTSPPSAYAQGGYPSGGFSQTGSFLGSALTTAAGVAGGMVLFDGIASLLSMHSGPFGGMMGGYGGAGYNQPEIVNETTNNYYDTPQDTSSAHNTNYTDQNDSNADVQNTSYQSDNTSDYSSGSDGDYGGGFDGGSI